MFPLLGFDRTHKYLPLHDANVLRLDTKRDWDVLSVLIVTPLLILAIYLLPGDILRIVLGLPFILFIPGYVTVLALFPDKEDLESIERVALSFGLSIAIAPLIGFGLNYTPWGIRLEPILICLSAYNVGVGLVGLYRRYRSKEPYVPIDLEATYRSLMSTFKAEKGADKALTIVLVISIVLAVSALIYVVAVPRPGEAFTEFYILGPDGTASGYPNNLTVGEEGEVIVGIVNHEQRTVNYTVEVWLVNATLVNETLDVNRMYYVDSFSVLLESVPVDLEGNWTPQWEMPYTFSFTVTGQFKLWFLLYKDTVPSLPNPPTSMEDYAGTIAEERIAAAVTNEVQSLNLNLLITPI
jgi:uncharacterized membrane protein